MEGVQISNKTVRRAVPSWYLIPEISPIMFLHCVTDIYSVLEEKHASKTSEDPFIKAVLMGHTTMTEPTWTKLEKARLSQKALEMKMGDFHEELMGKFPGYVTLPTGHITGCDVSSIDGNTLLEVKNKNNTIKGSDGKHVVAMLKKHADAGKRAILVEVNCPGGKVNRFGAHQSVHVWNGQEAYHFLSGRPSFFEDLEKTMKHVFAAFKTYAELKITLETE